MKNLFFKLKSINSYYLTFICAISIYSSNNVFAQQQAFTTIGAQNFNTPVSVVELTVEAIGGGGGGGLVRGTSARESGGGGGGAYAKGKVQVIPNTSYLVGVGNFGKKERGDSDARNGGDSYFNSDVSTDVTTTVRAQGGQTLFHDNNSDGTGKPGGQASASVGNLAKWNGGDGGSTSSNTFGGGGGGAAGSLSDGVIGGQNAGGASGNGNLLNGSSPGIGGLGGINNGNDSGTPGTIYGGGGGGARKSFSGSTTLRNGQPGAQGIVVITWSEVTSISPTVICSSNVITITGTQFTNVTDVSFNGLAASSFNVNSSTEITATAPVGATSGDLVVTTEYGKAKIAYTISNGSVYYLDNDNDNFGSATDSTTACTQPVGYVANNNDCDDNDANNTLGFVFYLDNDNDNFGSATDSTTACTQPVGYVANNNDCDDNDANITVATTWYLDSDTDGFGDSTITTIACTQPNGYVADSTDCDDTNVDLNPTTAWYIDKDQDGVGDSNVFVISCIQPVGYVIFGTDCDDNDETVQDICNITAISQLLLDANFNIYPNPTSGIINIEFDAEEMFEIAIYDVLGKNIEMNSQKVTKSKNVIKLNISDLPNAIYQIKIVNNEGSLIKRVIKE